MYSGFGVGREAGGSDINAGFGVYALSFLLAGAMGSAQSSPVSASKFFVSRKLRTVRSHQTHLIRGFSLLIKAVSFSPTKTLTYVEV